MKANGMEANALGAMTGAVLNELNKPLEIWSEIEIPKLKRGQVCVEIAYSGVCHSQLMEARGLRGQDPYLPHLLGHEGTGVVREIGPDVTKVRIGDRVILTWIKGKGLDGVPVHYSYRGQRVNAGGVTTFNSVGVVSENRLVQLPEGVAMDVGVLFGCALLTGAGIVLNQLKPASGSHIGVLGLGGVGLSALIACRAFSPASVIAMDIEDEKLHLARELGATHTLRADSANLREAIHQVTGQQGLDGIVEAAGTTASIETAFSLVKRNGGHCIFASHPANGEKIHLDPYDLICGKKIEGSWGGASQPDRDVPILAKLIAEHGVPIEKLISHRYPLSEINRALSDLESRRAARPLIEVQKELLAR